MNAKAKQRAWSRAPQRDEVELEGIPVEAAPPAPLVAPEGLQVFDVGEENVGERLDGTWARRRPHGKSRRRAPGSRR